MKPRDYCCCAIPIVNAGIYITLIEQFTLGILIGIIIFITPSIVGASLPFNLSWVLAIICFVGSGIQVLGFIGVAKEQAITFRRYVTIHSIITTLAFSVAAAIIAISAARHSNAKSKCLLDFFSGDLSDSTEGDTLCNIFPWVDIGIMGGLWALLAVLQIYLFVVLSSYGTSQRRDHAKYDALGSVEPLTASDSIPMQNRADPWDSRPSTESLSDAQNHKHTRQESSASASDIMNQPHQKPVDTLASSNAGYDSSYTLHADGQDSGPAYQNYGYTQDYNPPRFNNNNNQYFLDAPSVMNVPAQVPVHQGGTSYKS